MLKVLNVGLHYADVLKFKLKFKDSNYGVHYVIVFKFKVKSKYLNFDLDEVMMKVGYVNLYNFNVINPVFKHYFDVFKVIKVILYPSKYLNPNVNVAN